MRALACFALLALVSAAWATGPGSDVVELTGAFRLPDGSPAPGVRVEIDVERSRPAFGESGSAASSSDPDGRFRLRFERQGAGVVLRATLAGWADETLSWSWVPGRPTDLGEVELRGAGGVAGRVLDAAGDPVASGWTVVAYAPVPPEPNPQQCVSVLRARPGASAGSFRIDGLPEAPCLLELRPDDGGDAARVLVPVRAGTDAPVTIHHDGDASDARVRVSLSARPLFGAIPSLESITLSAPEVAPRHPVPSETRANGIEFDGLPPGSYTLRISDPRFSTVEESDLVPGGPEKSILLAGNSAIDLRVADAVTGAELDRAHVRLHVVTSPFRAAQQWSQVWDARTYDGFRGVESRAFDLCAPGRSLPADGVFRGLFAGEVVVEVGAPDRAPAYRPLTLAPDEVATVLVTLVAGGVVSGRVTRSDGAPLREETTVELYRPGDERRDPIGWTYGGPRMDLWPFGLGWERASAAIDANGTFRVEHVEPGTYTVRARDHVVDRDLPEARFVEAVVEGVEVIDRGEARVVLVLPFDR